MVAGVEIVGDYLVVGIISPHCFAVCAEKLPLAWSSFVELEKSGQERNCHIVN